jgi:hypothetical protein
MKKLKLLGTLLAFTLWFTSCDNNDEILVDPNADFDAVLDVKEAGPANPNVDVVVDANTASTIKAKVTFTTTTKDMARLYITQNIKAQGETIYEPTENIDLKGDGAVDLTGKNSKNFEFQFTLPVPAGVGAAGTVVYSFWTTTGNGDFRDKAQRLALGTGTITLKFGTGTNPNTGTAVVKSFTDIKLIPPLADGTSNTFISLLDGKVYNVKQGVEYVSLWDFGYLFSVSADAATLRAPFNYPTIAINIPSVAGTTNDELNKTYFKKSTKTTTEFDAITTSANLDFVAVDKVDANIIVKQLAANDVVEFIDQYGKKGLIKVLEVKPGNGSDGFIRFSVRVQP